MKKAVTYSTPTVETFALKGKTISSIDESGRFTTTDGCEYAMDHLQDCCERVKLVRVEGDIKNLVGEKLILAEDDHCDTPHWHKFQFQPESFTWTVFQFATRKGRVRFYWLGESNGYYGEDAQLYQLA